MCREEENQMPCVYLLYNQIIHCGAMVQCGIFMCKIGFGEPDNKNDNDVIEIGN